MKTLLRIDSSPRGKNSLSKQLADFFEKHWILENKSELIIKRNLSSIQIPHLNDKTIKAFHTPEENMTDEIIHATSLINKLIAEIKGFDEILISSPLHNLTVPSNLKSFIDQVVRINQTYKNSENEIKGFLTGKKVYLITTKGGFIKNPNLEKYDFQERYLKAILGYMGIETEAVFSLEGTSNERIIQNNINEVREFISHHFTNKRHKQSAS